MSELLPEPANRRGKVDGFARSGRDDGDVRVGAGFAQAFGAGGRGDDRDLDYIAVKYFPAREIRIAGMSDENIALATLAELFAQPQHARLGQLKHNAAALRPADALLLAQGIHAQDDAIGVSAQQVHQPPIGARLRDVRPRSVLSQQADNAVERLHEVAVDPRTVVGRSRKRKISVGSESVIGERARFSVVEEHFKRRWLAGRSHGWVDSIVQCAPAVISVDV